MNENEIRLKLFNDLPIDDLNDLTFINKIISWFKKNNNLRNFEYYRVHLVKNLKNNNNRVIANFGVVKIKREKTHKYYVCVEEKE